MSPKAPQAIRNEGTESTGIAADGKVYRSEKSTSPARICCRKAKTALQGKKCVGQNLATDQIRMNPVPAERLSRTMGEVAIKRCLRISRSEFRILCDP